MITNPLFITINMNDFIKNWLWKTHELVVHLYVPQYAVHRAPRGGKASLRKIYSFFGSANLRKIYSFLLVLGKFIRFARIVLGKFPFFLLGRS